MAVHKGGRGPGHLSRKGPGSFSPGASPDLTAPTLSSPTDAANGSTGATISVSTNEANGTLYWFISTSATPPSAANLKTGTGSVSSGSQAVSGTGVQNASPTGLTASTGYYAHFLHSDAAGNDSSIASGDGFTTTATPDVTAPTLTSPLGTQSGTTTATLGVTTNEANGTLYVSVLPSASAAPAAAAFIAGTTGGVYTTSTASPAVGANPFIATGLTAATGYKAHYFHRDAAGNNSTVVSSSTFTTASTAALTIAQTSASGASPFTWSIDYSAAQTAGLIAPGDFWHVRTSTDNFATTTQHITKMVTVDDLTTGAVSFLIADGADADFITPQGGTTFKLKMTYEREGVGESPDSNVLTETIASVANAVEWDSANKSPQVTLSNSDYTAAPNDNGAPFPVIGNASKTTGKWYFEVSVVIPTNFYRGMVGVANSLPTNLVTPGSASADAISYHNSGLVYRNSGDDAGASQAAYEAAGTYIIGVAFDADNDKVWFSKANTFAGSPAAGTGGHSPTGITNYFPMFAPVNTGVTGTIKTLLADLTYTPPAGFTALGEA